MRVLLLSYACEPGRGSEPGVGWNWASHLGAEHDVCVLTRENNREAIEHVTATRPLPRVRFVYFDLPRWARVWKKGNRGIRLYYYLWQLGAARVAKRLHAEQPFDVAHHVTFVKYWMPSAATAVDVPVVWGPVGGGESTPSAFMGMLSAPGRAYEWARELLRAVGELDPLVRRTARRATLALATTVDSERRMRAIGARDVRVLSEAGLSNADLDMLEAIPLSGAGPLRMVSIGNLIHLKAFDLGLRAFARFRQAGGEGVYHVVGGGPERPRLEALCAALGISGHVTFHGQVPRTEALARLRESDILVHPSLHDSGGWVCLEAMAAGRPPLCLDLGGPGLQVTAETGIKVPAESPEQAVAALSEAMLTLWRRPERRLQLAEAGRRYVRDGYAWPRKIERMTALYEQVVAGGLR